jgi:LysR family nitrogen assimilation transcriptional regulator
MEFGQLRHFVTIAEQRSLSRAADIVKVSQGTLSRQMADLERELGAHLFTRTGRGCNPDGRWSATP